MPASSRRQFLKKRNLLLLLGDLAGLLRSLLHCALRLLCLLSFLGHVALLMLSEMALVAACTRESRCTTSRIHQRMIKNSVPLKEVLTRQASSKRRAFADNTTKHAQVDAKRASKTANAIADIARNHCAAGTFAICVSNDRKPRDIVESDQ